MNPLDDAAINADRRWLRNTLTRASLRYGRALHSLSSVPGLLALANLHTDPYAPDVQDAAEAMAQALYAAMEELDRIALYMQTITDPGPTVCGVCGAELDTPWQTTNGSTHWRWVDAPGALFGRRLEEYDAGHAPEPVRGNPPRPDWSAQDNDLLSTDHRRAAQ